MSTKEVKLTLNIRETFNTVCTTNITVEVYIEVYIGWFKLNFLTSLISRTFVVIVCCFFFVKFTIRM